MDHPSIDTRKSESNLNELFPSLATVVSDSRALDTGVECRIRVGVLYLHRYRSRLGSHNDAASAEEAVRYLDAELSEKDSDK